MPTISQGSGLRRHYSNSSSTLSAKYRAASCTAALARGGAVILRVSSVGAEAPVVAGDLILKGEVGRHFYAHTHTRRKLTFYTDDFCDVSSKTGDP